MSMTATPPQESFRVDMLWNDARYRSTFIQTIALMLVMLAVAWLASNAVRNLEALGKDFNFSFLWQPASYDINQRLIEYDSRDSNARAALLGILNTLLVAAMGIVTATVIGVVAGVLRLSKNWIVSRLMAVYVEAFRNVPLLIWILMIAAAVNETLPAPSAFRGVETGAFVATNRGLYVPAPIFGEGSTPIVAIFLASLAGLFLLRRWAAKRQAETGEQFPVFWAGLALLVAPATLAFLALGRPIDLELPELAGFNFRGGFFLRDSLVAMWLALSLYTGAFIAETVRAGILAVSHGQSEAAYALGLRPNRAMSLVVLPQALRVIVPPLISQYLNLTKNSSLAIAVGYMDATGTLGGITLNQTGREMECILLLMAFYLTVSLLISGVMNWYNTRVKLVER
ncbi:amino acid ABC transporter permease [Rubrimonas cliftonensis]|uniref:L-glutamine ABC transporter membrane protein /L-glutamate ABC transporter membrane protein /L-aspartate ABC transporter membrane protein /L-asparagine ABC transporter membrane protein n=1 Tax=Rubrimonas cliftonensis TaxID=89524 RepID=A0A1H4DVK3_9RHOB|nr:ABC transporter permease subunit [Rubrimonas cliftonensis]SEA76538.1 L-glutamine ABC transporter membrane protein /L-glutamate ABC transporter membrane protein /L-aspartate ABC transporter membrane protein /L-asparagine ABC transporter membrane protein [Rubrimonas cliftonensis]